MYHEQRELVPFLMFGSLCLISALLTSVLPETLDRQLPDTLEEAVLQVRFLRNCSFKGITASAGWIVSELLQLPLQYFFQKKAKSMANLLCTIFFVKYCLLNIQADVQLLVFTVLIQLYKVLFYTKSTLLCCH
jgi:hypothetical protein